VTVTAQLGSSCWEVHDAGPRLSGETLDELFQPFVRSDEPMERRSSEVGLELTVARAYAEVLGGAVGGHANEAGTVFWLEVPSMADELR
jgi:K+-sensing histidine kinase KdpD